MYCNARVFGLGCAALAAICVCMLAAHLGAVDGRLLSASEMGSVGGGDPPCTHVLVYVYCFDSVLCLGEGEATCAGVGACSACTGSSLNSRCVESMFNDVIDCIEESESEYCGKYLDDRECEWDGQARRCNCVGTPSSLDCPQWFTTYDTDCEPQSS